MSNASPSPAAISQPSIGQLSLSGAWTALGMGAVERQLEALLRPTENGDGGGAGMAIDGAHIEALDTAGAWILQKHLRRLAGKSAGGKSATSQVLGLRPEFAKLLAVVEKQSSDSPAVEAPDRPRFAHLEAIGRKTAAAGEQAFAMLSFIGQCAMTFGQCLLHPGRLRWRPILFNIRSAGFDAMPIVGLLSFLLGVVVAYQGADQLRQYGANIFVADLVGLSMLREFSPLMTAIIIAGRSGSAYAAQIGSMAVTEEIDAMRTIGIVPIELLVLPKVIALMVVMPLLTVFADVLGVLGGMIMANAQLGVGFEEFLERFIKAVSLSAFLIGICKAPVFAGIIVVVGCFQGFRTQGGPDSVGLQTTRSVVQSIFLVIVADALFSVVFSALDL